MRSKRRPSGPPRRTSIPQLHSHRMQAVGFHTASAVSALIGPPGFVTDTDRRRCPFARATDKVGTVKRTAFSDWPCSIARSVDLLGDWWTPLVLRDAYFGAKRFEHFQRSLGIGRNVLTQRLNRLVDEGLFERVRYQDHPP